MMAWRNVRRDRRRSLVTIAAMSFALWVLVLYSGLIEGYMVALERDVLDLEVGDLQIFAPTYRDRPSLYARIPDPEALVQRLEGEGFRASARLLGGGLAASESSSAGVAFIGLDVRRDAGVTRVQELVSEGSWLDPADPSGVVLGRRLARSLSVSPGDELVVLSQAADGSLANELFTVRGVLLGIAGGMDQTAVYMSENAFRSLMVVPDGAHQMLVRRASGQELESAAAEARAMAPDLDVQTWRELLPTIATMLDSSRSMIFVIFFVVYLAVGILILNAMLMAVFERIRELGVLKALGVGPLQVMALILCESAIQTAVAVGAGLLLSLPGMWYLSQHGIHVGRLAGATFVGVALRPVWHGIYGPATVFGPVLALVVIVLAAVIYPGLKAAWIQPVEAMRH